MTLTASRSVLAETADIVFTNADVRTMDEAKPRAQSVAVTGNTITYGGDFAVAQALIGKETRFIDARPMAVWRGSIRSTTSTAW